MRAFYTRWSALGMLPLKGFAEERYLDPAAAAEVARKAGADVAVTGTITYLLHGGTAGDSALALDLEIIEAATAQPLFRIQQAGRMQADLTKDYIFLARRTRMPTDPLLAVVNRLATDMAGPVQLWLAGPPPPEPENSAKKRREAREAEEIARADLDSP
jgi:hypothetical protein